MSRYFLWLALVVHCHSATITADSTSRAHVLAAIESAAAGDTVIIPAGASLWTSAITITNPIYIFGSGTNSTYLTNGTSASQGLETGLFHIQLLTEGRIEIASNNLWGVNYDDSDGIQIANSGIFERSVVIHDNVFNRFSFGIKNNGAWGVVYNCYFISNDVAFRVAGFNTEGALPVSGAPYGWDSTNTFVFENCMFSHVAWTENTYQGDTEYPALYTVRHCDFYDNRGAVVGIDGFDMHGETGSGTVPIGILVYSNRWTITGNTTVNPMRICDIRGGANTLIYSNKVTGLAAEVMWRDNPTAGNLLTNSYAWGNEDNSGEFTYSSLNSVAENTHYFLSAPGNFAELTYPHPLRGSAPPPDPVTGARGPGIGGIRFGPQ